MSSASSKEPQNSYASRLSKIKQKLELTRQTTSQPPIKQRINSFGSSFFTRHRRNKSTSDTTTIKFDNNQNINIHSNISVKSADSSTHSLKAPNKNSSRRSSYTLKFRKSRDKLNDELNINSLNLNSNSNSTSTSSSSIDNNFSTRANSLTPSILYFDGSNNNNGSNTRRSSHTPSIVIGPSGIPVLLTAPGMDEKKVAAERPNMLKSLSQTAITFDESPVKTVTSVGSNDKDSNDNDTPKRTRSRTLGSVENDLYRKSTLVKTIGSMIMRPKSTSMTYSSLELNEVLNPTPEPEADDSPEEYIKRLITEGFEPQLTSKLAESDSVFYKSCLEYYFQVTFNFKDEALDIALRRFLFKCTLPKETQQIDRVLDCFSKRYYDLNFNYWDNSDQVYFLVFSLVMLQTDFFNSNNKKKMTKLEFIKNTRVKDEDEKISNADILTKEILEYFYDNITFYKFLNYHQSSATNSNNLYTIPKKIFSSNSSTNLESLTANSTNINTNNCANGTATNNTTAGVSSPGTNSSFINTDSQRSLSHSSSQYFNFNFLSIDPYQYIIDDQIDSLKLKTKQFNINFNPIVRDNFLISINNLNKIKEILIKDTGIYLQFNKDCSWLPSKTEVFTKDSNEETHYKSLLKVIKVGEIFKEEEKFNSKFFIGLTTKIVKTRYIAMLTSCGLFFFENLNFLSISEREKLLNFNYEDENEQDLIVDVNSDILLKNCSKLLINGLFACQIKKNPRESVSEEDLSSFDFNIYSKNKKEKFSVKSEKELKDWMIAINYISALDNCLIEIKEFKNFEVLSLRKISIEEKINKLHSNLPLTIDKINKSIMVINHLSILSPFNQKTRESLLNHFKSLETRIDWLWYEFERNSVLIELLQLEIQNDDSTSLKTESNDSFLEDSFINNNNNNTNKIDEELSLNDDETRYFDANTTMSSAKQELNLQPHDDDDYEDNNNNLLSLSKTLTNATTRVVSPHTTLNDIIDDYNDHNDDTVYSNAMSSNNL